MEELEIKPLPELEHWLDQNGEWLAHVREQIHAFCGLSEQEIARLKPKIDAEIRGLPWKD